MLLLVTILLNIYIGLFGLVLGSFLGMASYRLPHGESIVTPRSKCTHCGHGIAWYENIPVLSYLFLRGHCRYCHEGISALYPILELTTATLTLLAYHKFGSNLRFALYLTTLIAPMLLLGFIDWKYLLLPDVVTLPGTVIAFIVHWVDGRFLVPVEGVTSLSLLLESLIGALVGAGTLFLLAWLYLKIRKKEGMGGGDIKLAAMIGAFFGWHAIFFVFLLASLVGLLLGVVLILVKRQDTQMQLPFGTCLAMTAILYLFYGRELLLAYLTWFSKLI